MEILMLYALLPAWVWLLIAGYALLNVIVVVGLSRWFRLLRD